MSKYFNNAGAGLMSETTVAAVSDHLQLEMEIGAAAAAGQVTDRVSQFYADAARLIGGGEAVDVAYCDSASRAWATMIDARRLKSGARVVTLASEFGTNLVNLYNVSSIDGIEVVVIPCNEDGGFSLDALEQELSRGADLLAVSHVAMQGSIINPVTELGEMANEYDVPFLVDGCQAAGMIPVNVNEINCDVYTVTGRKWLRGPRGTAFIWVRPDSPFEARQVDLASAGFGDSDTGGERRVLLKENARQFELWERSVACLLGLGSAIREALDAERDGRLVDIGKFGTAIRTAIAGNQKLVLVGERESPSGIASFYTRSAADDQAMAAAFERAGITHSSVATWDCPLVYPRGAERIFRLSPHHYTPAAAVQEVASIIESF